jgi:hypothetical protein
MLPYASIARQINSRSFLKIILKHMKIKYLNFLNNLYLNNYFIFILEIIL